MNEASAISVSSPSQAAGAARIGIGGPVGSGKTALLEVLCKRLRERYDIAVETNDIYTQEDAQFLIRAEALEEARIVGVVTGGCPHTAIREDASINLAAVDQMTARFPDLEIVFIESGGDNLAATFSPELADVTVYVIDVSAGDKIPRKGGPGITRSDLLIINKIDLAPCVGASLEVMDRDSRRMRGARARRARRPARSGSATRRAGRPRSTADSPGCRRRSRSASGAGRPRARRARARATTARS